VKASSGQRRRKPDPGDRSSMFRAPQAGTVSCIGTSNPLIPRFRRVLRQREMRSGPVIIFCKRFHLSRERRFAEGDHLIQALPSNGADDALHISHLPRSARGRKTENSIERNGERTRSHWKCWRANNGRAPGLHFTGHGFWSAECGKDDSLDKCVYLRSCYRPL
jgi:hypothetical protein